MKPPPHIRDRIYKAHMKRIWERRLWYQRAPGQTLRPRRPRRSPTPVEQALAYCRGAPAGRSVWLVVEGWEQAERVGAELRLLLGGPYRSPRRYEIDGSTLHILRVQGHIDQFRGHDFDLAVVTCMPPGRVEEELRLRAQVRGRAEIRWLLGGVERPRPRDHASDSLQYMVDGILAALE